MHRFVKRLSRTSGAVVSCSRRRRFVHSGTKFEINGNIQKLALDGQLQSAVHEMNNMIKRGMSPDNFTLSSILRGCRKYNDSKLAKNIWTNLVESNVVIPHPSSYVIALHLFVKNVENSKNTKISKVFVYDMVNQLNEITNNFDTLDITGYWAVINAYRFLNDFENVLNIYNKILHSKHSMTPYIISLILQSCCDCKKPYYYKKIWDDMNSSNNCNLSEVMNCYSLQKLMTCILQSNGFDGESDNYQILHVVWNTFTMQLNKKPGFENQCFALFVCSKFVPYYPSMNEFFNEISSVFWNSRENKKLLKEKNQKYFRMVLSSYGNIGKLDEMWDIYNVYKNDENIDMEIVTTLTSKDDRKEKIAEIFELLTQNNNYKLLSPNQIKYFYRLSVRYNMEAMTENLFKMLKCDEYYYKPGAKAFFQFNGQEMYLINGTNRGEFEIIEHIEILMKKCNFTINTIHALELRTEYAREQHLKCHAEKKALAFLLLNEVAQNENVRIIEIGVSLRMCGDCHHFFAKVSTVTQKPIQCVDKKGVHFFVDGKCRLCDIGCTV